MDCPCGSGAAYAACCEPLITGERDAETAEALMRARYTAYARADMEFLLASLHPDYRDEHDPDQIRAWAEESKWHGLEILATEAGGPTDETGNVEFVAEYTYDGEHNHHHERAVFSRHEGRWYFVEGDPVKGRPYVRDLPKVGRNDPCPCGSGRKYKRCCGS